MKRVLRLHLLLVIFCTAPVLAQAITSPLPFIGITPCRIADTRDATYPAGYGPPSLAAGVPRNFTLTGQCGIAGTAQAVSLNITVTNTLGPGFILIYPRGGAQPLVSTLNYVAGQTLANAAVVPLGTGGGVTVIAGVSGTDLVIDVNGHYAGSGTASTTNTFLGLSAGNSTTIGSSNTAVGASAFFSNITGSDNTAIGHGALQGNLTGGHNTAIGDQAMFNTSSGNNTAVGDSALYGSSGTNNVAIGFQAGQNLATGNGNICIANGGVASDSNTIRIGGVQTRAFIAGIRGVTTDTTIAIPVLIDPSGQLGTTSSSARVKDRIRDMGGASSALLKLRPVTFRYKAQADGPRHFGLIAEEVEEVLPELVVHRSTGEAETVLYHEMPAMLLNELQKQHQTIEEQRKQIDTLRKEKDEQLAALAARLVALEGAMRVQAESR